MYTLRLLGGLSLGSESGALTGRAAQKRRLALLSLLAMAPTRLVSRDKLIGYLWPESDTEQARHLLSVALYELRKGLGDEVVVSRGDDVALSRDGVQTDVQAFDEAVAAGRLDQAVEHYGGPFLDGFFLSEAPEFERWVDGERDRLARRYQDTLERLAQERTTAGDPRGAADAWRRLSAVDPYNSRIAAGLMEALAAAGDRAGALQHARAHELLLKQEFDAEPDPSIVALAARLRAEPAPAIPGIPTARGRNDDRLEPAPRAASIAVLPFADLSPARDNQYFSDGLTEEIINALTRVDGLQVAARTSTFALRERGLEVREAGEALRVRTVLEGSVRKAGDRLRITASLVDVKTGFQLWGESYDRDGGDVFVVQDELARAVVGALRGHLEGGDAAPLVRPSTPNLDAYTLYLKGRYHWYRRTTDGLRQALSYFEQAVARDPTYALAYTGIGDVSSLLGAHDYGFLPPNDAFPAAKKALARALELDPGSAATHAALGNVHLIYDWDWRAAEEEFRRALQLDPQCAPAHHWYALGLLAAGRREEAITAMRRARELEPLSMVLSTGMGRVFYFDRQTDLAIDEYRRSLEMDSSFVPAHLGLGLSYIQVDEPELAVEEYRKAGEILGGEQPVVRALIAHARAHSGLESEARASLCRLEEGARERYIPAEYLAVVHLGLGDRAAALDALEQAFAHRSGSMVFFHLEPLLDPVREEPRFQALLKKMTL